MPEVWSRRESSTLPTDPIPIDGDHLFQAIPTTYSDGPEKAVAFRPEWVVAFRRNQWSPSRWNRWPLSPGKRRSHPMALRRLRSADALSPSGCLLPAGAVRVRKLLRLLPSPNRDHALGDANPLGLAEQFELIVVSAGQLGLPQEVCASLHLEPGDLFSLVKHPISLQLESYSEFLAENWAAFSRPTRWLYAEEFLRRPLTALEANGAISIPDELLPLGLGDRLVLEVVTRGLSHDLFLYPLEG
jgi:hypothetical protein